MNDPGFSSRQALAPGTRADQDSVLSSHQALADAGGGVIVVTGARGVGKGTVLNEIRRELVAGGRVVLFGRAEKTASRPYASLVEPASQALTFLESRGIAETFLEHHAHALSVLLPRLAPPASSGRARDKTAFFEAMRAFFLDLQRYAATTVMLTDIHYADDDTRELLRFLAAHVFDANPLGGPKDGAGGVLMLAVRTDDERGTSFLRGLGEIKSLTRRDVNGLNQAGLLAYLASHPALEKLLAASHGRPEDVDDLLSTLPEDADVVARERFSHLDAVSSRLCHGLALLGRPAPADLVAEIAGVALSDAAQALGRLVEKNIVVRRLKTGELLFTFARPHHLELLAGTIDDDERRALHHGIALSLERRQNHDDANDYVLAVHFLNGTDPAQGTSYALRACQSLLVLFAYSTAIELAKRALDVATDDETRAALLGHLVEAYRLKGEPRRALDAAHALRDVALTHDHAKVLRIMGELRSALGEHKEAMAHLDEAIQRLPDVDDGSGDALPERALIFAAMADAAYLRGDYERADDDATRALNASPKAPVGFEIRIQNMIGKIAYAREDFKGAERLFLENLRRAESASLEHEITLMRINAGLARFRLGNHKDAQEILERALVSARAVGDIYNEAHGELNLGVIAQRLSDLGRSLRHYLAALQLFSRLGNRTELRRTTWNLANVYVAIGHVDKARLFLEQSRRLAEAEDSDRGRAFVSFTEGDIAFDEGQPTAALTAYEKARTIFERLGESSRVIEMSMKAAWATLHLGDVDAARGFILACPKPGAGTLAQARHDALEGGLMMLDANNDGALFARGSAQLSRAIDDAERHQASEDAWRALSFLADRYDAHADSKSADAARRRARDVIIRLAELLPTDLAPAFLSHPIRRSIVGGDVLDAHAVRREEGAADVDAAVDDDETFHDLLVHEGPVERIPEWDARYGEIIGKSPPLLRMFERLDRITRAHQPNVLVRGESGTGKELVASAVHRLSERQSGPFVRVNCAALVETLLMSELFGHEKGSFTGAFARKIGRFELARGGTIFLDEIGDISPKTQMSLLRVLQERSFERVGGTQTIQTDAVVICATHRDLETMVADGSFREDLYYRLRGVILEVAPLRERPDDIAELLGHFLVDAQRELGRAPTRVSVDALSVLQAYAWPGNIRELQNVVRSVALFCEGDVVELRHLTEFPELFSERVGGRLRRKTPASEAGAFPTASTLPSPRPTTNVPSASPPSSNGMPHARAAPARSISTAPNSSTTTPPRHVPGGTPTTTTTASNGDVYRHVEVTHDDREGVALGEMKRRLEFDAIAGAMRQTGGNITRAAKLLKMKRPRLSQIVNADPELKAIKETVRGERG